MDFISRPPPHAPPHSQRDAAQLTRHFGFRNLVVTGASQEFWLIFVASGESESRIRWSLINAARMVFHDFISSLTNNFQSRTDIYTRFSMSSHLGGDRRGTEVEKRDDRSRLSPLSTFARVVGSAKSAGRATQLVEQSLGVLERGVWKPSVKRP
jgi:hypothetical protein